METGKVGLQPCHFIIYDNIHNHNYFTFMPAVNLISVTWMKKARYQRLYLQLSTVKVLWLPQLAEILSISFN